MNKKNLFLPIVGLATALITITACDKGEDSVAVPVSGSEAGHDYVDLGLIDVTSHTGNDVVNNIRVDTIYTTTFYFANCNIGANNPQDIGEYFAWGETETKNNYTLDDYFDKGENDNTYKKYNKDFKTIDTKKGQPNLIIPSETSIVLEPNDDVAFTKWGDSWHMPTSAMWGLLQSNCYWVWTSGYNGSNQSGYIVYKTKKDTDKGRNKNEYTKAEFQSTESYSLSDPHIFLPAGGRYIDSKCEGAGSEGCYWVSNLSDSEGYFTSANPGGVITRLRYHGRLVRPVHYVIETKTVEVEIK